MASENYDACYKYTLKFEGGYVNHPKDPGGATNKGIIQRVYDGYRRRRGMDTRSVRYIDDHEVREIYRTQYWNAVRGDDLPKGVDLAVWDYGVNSGPSRAIKAMQAILGVRVDGAIGEATLAAVEVCDSADLVNKLCDQRLAFVKRLTIWKTFGKGWSRRISEVRRIGVAMAEKRSAVPPVAEYEAAPKADGPPATTKQEGFWAKAGAILSLIGAGVTGILKEVPWQVGVAAVIVCGAIAAYFLIFKKDAE